jgi:hypothetical protein
MSLLAILRIALKALRVNKLRSALTMLGMIIGVAAVIAMIAIGSGAQERVREQIKGLGSNLILVFPGSTTASGVRLGAGRGAVAHRGRGRRDDARNRGASWWPHPCCAAPVRWWPATPTGRRSSSAPPTIT